LQAHFLVIEKSKSRTKLQNETDPPHFQMSILWTIAHQPPTLEACTIHPKQTSLLKALAATREEMPHLMVYGGMGAGKSTRIRGLLHALYGPKAWVKRICTTKTFETGPSKTHTLSVYMSPYHVELDATAMGAKDRVVVQHFIKTKAEDMARMVSSIPFVIVVIENANRLTMDAQQGLRRTMEVYGDKCKLILSASSRDGIIPALLSRVAPVRLPLATHEETIQVLNESAEAYGEDDLLSLRPTFIKIAEECKGNLKKALLAAQSTLVLGRSKVQSLTKLVKSSIMDMAALRPIPSTAMGMRPTFASLLGSVLSPSELLGVMLEVGAKGLERKKRSHQISIWVDAICEADLAIKRSASPIAALEYVVLTYSSLLAK
jgi:replication factor C subunit 3/5